MTKEEKKGFGEKLKSVTSLIDIFADVITSYVSNKFKVKEKVEDVRQSLIESSYAFKRGVVRSAVEIFLLCTGLMALLVGIIWILSKHFVLEYLLFGYGLIVTIGVLMWMKLKP